MRGFSTHRILTRGLGCTLFVASLSAGMVSCSNDMCYDNHNALPLASLYSSSAPTKEISVDSISVWGIGAPNDSLLLDTARNVQQIYLPFRIDDTSTSFVLRYDAVRRLSPTAPNDTLSFTYQPVPVFESQACGVFYRFDNVRIDYTTHFIDSVVCPEGYIDNRPAANLQIFFRTQPTN